MRAAIIVLLVACADVGESPKSTTLGMNECDDTLVSSGWHNAFVPQSTGRSAYFFKVVPSGGAIDAVIGISDGRADAFRDLGPILRFNPQGFVDARNGGTYQAAQAFRYQAGVTYKVQIEVDLDAHTYFAGIADDAKVQTEDGEDLYTWIAEGFAFRTEQASVERLDNIGRKIDSATGALKICNFSTALHDDYLSSGPGAGWTGAAFPAQSGRFRVEFSADADHANDGFPGTTDGVMGLSRAMPRYFSDLAAIVRFNPAGHFDARDGSSYRYDTLIPYTGNRWLVMMDVDIEAKRYSVSVAPWDQPTRTTTLATNYAFRTEQRGVTSLGVFGQINDGASNYVFTTDLKVSY